MPWKAVLRHPGGIHYMEVYIQDTDDYYNEEYGITVTNEMEAKRLALRQERKARERDPSRLEYELESLEHI